MEFQLYGFFVELVDVVDSGVCHGGLEFVDDYGYIEGCEVFFRHTVSLWVMFVCG